MKNYNCILIFFIAMAFFIGAFTNKSKTQKPKPKKEGYSINMTRINKNIERKRRMKMLEGLSSVVV